MGRSSPVFPLGIAGVTLAAYASGIMFSLTRVTIPTVLLSKSESTTLSQWLSTYSLGKASVPLVALASSACSSFNAAYICLRAGRFTRRAGLFVAAGVLPVLIAPMTALLLESTNDKLKAREQKARAAVTKGEGSDEVTAETKELIQDWGRLNASRSLLPIAGALMAVSALW